MSLFSSSRFLMLHLRAGSASMAEMLLREEGYIPNWPLSTVQGRKLMKRQFDFCGYKVEMPDAISWMVKDAGTDWHRQFFSYSWLQDVAAVHSDKVAGSFAREYINGFCLLKAQEEVHHSAWEAEVAGERLSHWLYYRQFVLKGASRTFFTRYIRTLIRHIRLIYAQGQREPGSLGPNALKGLIIASTLLSPLGFMMQDALLWLRQLMARDVLTDGGHISHSPNHHLSFVKTLIEIRQILEDAHISLDELNETITRMGMMLQSFCHGDGRLALFYHNLMEDAQLIARAIELAGGPFEPVTRFAEDSGYFSYISQQMHLLMRICPKQASQVPLGIGSLELSDGAERVIVNCGTYAGASSSWHQAMRQPSVFSTFVLEGEPYPAYGALQSQMMEEKLSRTSVMLRYQLDEGVLHERSLEINRDARLLKGRDTLELREGMLQDKPLAAVARFHLHPDIRCQLQKDGQVVLNSVMGMQWVFSCSLPKLVVIEESVFLGYDGKPQKTLQIAVKVPVHENNSGLRWEFRKQL